MKVNILCTDQGWIYSKFIAMYRQYSKHQILLNQKGDYDVVHCLPYYELTKSHKQSLCTAWFSHQEVRKDLYNKYIYVAKNVDFAITHSKKHANILMNDYGIKNVKQIMPGVDLYKFRLRKEKKEFNDKLIVGFVGRQYQSSNRKNPKLLKEISNLDFVDFRITGGNIKEKNMPNFYSELDLVVSPATNEAGPMSHIESAVCGVPFLCYDNVGTAREIDYGTIRVEFGNETEFIKRIFDFYNNKEFMIFNKTENMIKMRKQVEGFSWELFVKHHDEVIDKICEK